MIRLDLDPKIDPEEMRDLTAAIMAFGSAYGDRPRLAETADGVAVHDIPKAGAAMGAVMREATVLTSTPEHRGRYDHLSGEFKARDVPAMRAITIGSDILNRLSPTAAFRDDDALFDILETDDTERLLILIDSDGLRAAHGPETE
ncbi:MAG: hypothetical protein AAF919_06715 [Pseudomonadota bacterium]